MENSFTKISIRFDLSHKESFKLLFGLTWVYRRGHKHVACGPHAAYEVVQCGNAGSKPQEKRKKYIYLDTFPTFFIIMLLLKIQSYFFYFFNVARETFLWASCGPRIYLSLKPLVLDIIKDFTIKKMQSLYPESFDQPT